MLISHFCLLEPPGSPPWLTFWSWEGVAHGAPSKGSFKTSGPQRAQFRTASEWSLVSLPTNGRWWTAGPCLRPSVRLRASPDPAALKNLRNTQSSASASLISLGSWPAMVQKTFSPMGLPVEGSHSGLQESPVMPIGSEMPLNSGPSRVCCSIFKLAIKLFVKKCSPMEL